MSKKIKLMADYHCWPLWWAGEDAPGNLDPKDLPLPEELILDLDKWAAKYDSQLDQNDPISSDFFDGSDMEAFAHEGRLLWERLKKALNPTFDVWYFDPMSRELLK